MAGRGTIVVHLLMLIALMGFFIHSLPQAMAEEELQEEPPKGTPTSHLNSRMFMFGVQDAQQYSYWEAWTHAGSDGTSDSQFSEGNLPGQANSGGGNRAFTFAGSAPNPEPIRMDPSIPFSGAFTLSLNCEQSQDSCTKQVRLNLLYGQSFIGGVLLNAPIEGSSNRYEFNISHDLEEIEENVSIGIKIEFTKPHDITGGYTLYLKNEFHLDVPTLPPEEFVVEVKDGGTYESPFATKENGFSTIGTKSSSSFTAIIWGVVILACGIPLIAFTPPIGLKIPAVIIAMLGMLFSITIMPFVTMATPYSESDLGSKVLTPEDLVSQGNVENQFLSGFPEGSEFQLWLPLDSVYENSIEVVGSKGPEDMYVYGMGFDEYVTTFSDPGSTTKHGLSKVQQFFSVLEVDPSKGKGVLIDVVMVKRCADCIDVVPQWGTTLTQDENSYANDTRTISLNNGNSILYVIPSSAITVTNVDPTWKDTPMYSSIGTGVLLIGIGVLLQHRSNRAYEAWMLEQEEDV